MYFIVPRKYAASDSFHDICERRHFITEKRNLQMKFASDAGSLEQGRTFYQNMNHPVVGW
jgi:hypothetical protein